MQLDIHYYAIYQLSRLAGFKKAEAETIAYASQYVDDSTEGDVIRPAAGQMFDTVRTAHYSLQAFEEGVQKKVYFPFHFLPATIRRQTGAAFSYVTQPGTGHPDELATRLVADALSEGDRLFGLIRLGVALHTVADTFSHFGFSGRWNEENDVESIKLLRRGKGWIGQVLKQHGDIVAPKIGHGEAFDFPDIPYLKWEYKDHADKVHTRDNLVWTVKGLDLIYHFLKIAQACPPGSSGSAPVVGPVERGHGLQKEQAGEYKAIATLLKNRDHEDGRCKAWRKHTGAPKYDKLKWRKAALKGNVRWDGIGRFLRKLQLADKVEVQPGFDRSHWAYFHRAAWKQRALVVGWLN